MESGGSGGCTVSLCQSEFFAVVKLASIHLCDRYRIESGGQDCPRCQDSSRCCHLGQRWYWLHIQPATYSGRCGRLPRQIHRRISVRQPNAMATVLSGFLSCRIVRLRDRPIFLALSNGSLGPTSRSRTSALGTSLFRCHLRESTCAQKTEPFRLSKSSQNASDFIFVQRTFTVWATDQ
jgi:hypothetical protein